jgi:alpha/beta superfamily hydrolase
VSFSFLAACVKPCMVFIGKGDFLYSESAVAAVRAAAGPGVRVCVRATGDHFFRGEEDSISAIAEAFLRDRILPD